MKTLNYYAVLTKLEDGVVVKIPDIDNFQSIGSDFAHAFSNTVEEIQSFIENENITCMKRPSTFNEVKMMYSRADQVILPVPIRMKHSGGKPK